MLRYLRDLKAGQRAFDVNEVRTRVMREARARVPYRLITVDVEKGQLTYRAGPASA